MRIGPRQHGLGAGGEVGDVGESREPLGTSEDEADGGVGVQAGAETGVVGHGEVVEAGQVSMVTALVRSSFLVDAVYAQAGREYGLTPQQGQLLCVLMPQPYGMGELGRMLSLAKSSLTGLVDRMSRRGLVERRPAADDRRAVVIALTRAGARLADEFHTGTCRRIEALGAGLDEAERTRLAALPARVVTENEVPEVFTDTA